MAEALRNAGETKEDLGIEVQAVAPASERLADLESAMVALIARLEILQASVNDKMIHQSTSVLRLAEAVEEQARLLLSITGDKQFPRSAGEGALSPISPNEKVAANATTNPFRENSSHTPEGE